MPRRTPDRPNNEGQPKIFYGWYVLAASFAILFLNAGVRFFIGVMVKPLIEDFGWSRSAVSAAVFLNMAVYAVAVVVTGRLYDRKGPKWVILISTALFAAGYVLMSVMTSLWQFMLLYGVVIGASFGATTVPLYGAIVSKWFLQRRGLAISVAMGGNCLGQFFLVPVFTDMMLDLGWRPTSLWMGVAVLALNTLLTLLVLRGDPDDLGKAPYGSADPETTGSRDPVVTSVCSPERDLSLRQAMRTSSLWLFAVAMFVCGGGDFLLTTHLVPMVTDYGMPAAEGARMLAWFGLLSLGGILVAGPVSDRVGNRTPMAITFGIRVALFLMIVFFKGATALWIFALSFGFTLLVTAPLTTTLAGRLYGFTHVGTIGGFITTVHHVGGGLWAYLGGLVYDSTGGYELAFIISAVLSGVAVACTIAIREERAG